MLQDPTAIDVAIGERLRARRVELGMTREGLAMLIGVAPDALDGYESGHVRLGATTLLKLTQVLSVELRYFLGRRGASIHTVSSPTPASRSSRADG